MLCRCQIILAIDEKVRKQLRSFQTNSLDFLAVLLSFPNASPKVTMTPPRSSTFRFTADMVANTRLYSCIRMYWFKRWSIILRLAGQGVQRNFSGGKSEDYAV